VAHALQACLPFLEYDDLPVRGLPDIAIPRRRIQEVNRPFFAPETRLRQKRTGIVRKRKRFKCFRISRPQHNPNHSIGRHKLLHTNPALCLKQTFHFP
jgi:hypothetical protein